MNRSRTTVPGLLALTFFSLVLGSTAPAPASAQGVEDDEELRERLRELMGAEHWEVREGDLEKDTIHLRGRAVGWIPLEEVNERRTVRGLDPGGLMARSGYMADMAHLVIDYTPEEGEVGANYLEIRAWGEKQRPPSLEEIRLIILPPDSEEFLLAPERYYEQHERTCHEMTFPGPAEGRWRIWIGQKWSAENPTMKIPFHLIVSEVRSTLHHRPRSTACFLSS